MGLSISPDLGLHWTRLEPLAPAPSGCNANGCVVELIADSWTTADGQTAVMKVAKSGGSPVVLASGQTYPSYLALDATRVYWTNQDSVAAAPIGGGVVTELAPSTIKANGIAVDATSVYWTAAEYVNVAGAGALMKVAKP
jgi:hypothetical protein